MTTLADALTNATEAVNRNAQEYFDLEERVALREAGAVKVSGQVPSDADDTELAQAMSLGARFVAAAGGTVNALMVALAGGVSWPALKAGMEFTLPTLGPNTDAVTVAVAGFAAAPVSVAGLPAGTLRLLGRNGGQLKPGDLSGDPVRVRADGAGGLRLTSSAPSEVNQSIFNYIAGQPAVQSLFVDPVSGDDTRDGSSPAKAKKTLATVLDGMGTSATAVFLMGDVVLVKRHSIYAPLVLYGVQAANNAAGYSFTPRTIGFIGTAANSPDVLGNSYPSGFAVSGSSVVTNYISFALPVQVANQTYPAHLYSESGANFTLLNGTLSVAAASAGPLLGTHSLSINAYSNLALASGAAGHLFEGIPAGTNPNNFYNYRSNVTSG
ncbi:hypothetical protein [Methylobacterium radiotolerans]|uniref:hypothetical protein n=1 Tax=Methylobacterium radiotolerans TaxID=31998 RepID=UPI001F38A514|nr:hypothetical protein [Methylobacterium radiotolerans]UIY44147.1 hypothetical protein LZ599_10860 [Methylobacterium radiotolerans]